MGIVQKMDPKRDHDLIKDYLLTRNGKWVYSISQIGVRYGRIEDDKLIPLTATRIHQILDKYGVEKKRVVKKKKKKK